MTRSGQRAAFIDRDGTLIVEREYLSDPAGVELLPGAVEALQQLRAAGFSLIVVTNQAGIARGFYSEADYLAVRDRIADLLAQRGIVLDAVYHCPHHPDFTGTCDCRKPGPGMYQRAALELGVDLARSVYFGDRLSDVLPALRFGGQGVLVRTGYGATESAAAPSEITVVSDLLAGALFIAEARR